MTSSQNARFRRGRPGTKVSAIRPRVPHRGVPGETGRLAGVVRSKQIVPPRERVQGEHTTGLHPLRMLRRKGRGRRVRGLHLRQASIET